jgi:hypothetical protein
MVSADFATLARRARPLDRGTECLGLSVGCERDDAGEATLLLRVAGD